MPGLYQCRGCRQEKSLDGFHLRRNKAGARVPRPHCRLCEQQTRRKWKERLRRKAGVVARSEWQARKARQKMRRLERLAIERARRSQRLRMTAEEKACRIARYEKQRRTTREVRARRILQAAVRDGRVAKPTHCEGCRVEVPREKLHAHHDRYDLPFSVRWLCAACHGLLHRIKRKSAGMTFCDTDNEATRNVSRRASRELSACGHATDEASCQPVYSTHA